MEEKCMGLKNEVALQEKQTGDVDRQLDETTRELHREREKLMAVIRMSGDLIFEYDIVNDKMYYAGPGEGILYSRQITEGYTDQLLKEAGNRTETVEQQLAEALRSGKPDLLSFPSYVRVILTFQVIGNVFYRVFVKHNMSAKGIVRTMERGPQIVITCHSIRGSQF